MVSVVPPMAVHRSAAGIWGTEEVRSPEASLMTATAMFPWATMDPKPWASNSCSQKPRAKKLRESSWHRVFFPFCFAMLARCDRHRQQFSRRDNPCSPEERMNRSTSNDYVSIFPVGCSGRTQRFSRTQFQSRCQKYVCSTILSVLNSKI